MKLFALLLFILFASSTLAQVKPSKFSLTFSSFNHAAKISEGTTTYLLTESSIKVTKTSAEYFGKTETKTVYFSPIPISKSERLISEINEIGLDSLKEYYFNECIMITSGDEYFFSFANSKLKKEINLHHYYLKQIEDVVRLINSIIPQKYHFKYLDKETKQDCTL